jgi:hypothetical protein
MLALGCDSALNLDGGGSTEMVRADTLGVPYIVNNPSGGAERFDAAALGVYALPLNGTPRTGIRIRSRPMRMKRSRISSEALEL